MISSLEELVHYLENKANASGEGSVFGVVVDSSFPFYRPATKDYLSEVTIIDRTMPNSKYTFRVYLISEKPNYITMSEVGEVILFSRFSYTIKGDYFIEGRPTHKSSIQRADDPQDLVIRLNQISPATHPDNFAITKNWFLERFSDLYAPKIGIDKSILNQKVMVAKPFSLILKVKEATKTILSTTKSAIAYKLLDDSNNEFGLTFPVYFQPNSYIIIKNITHVQSNLHLVLNSFGNALLLPKPMPYDYNAITSQKEEYNNVMVLTSIKYSCDIEETSVTFISGLLSSIEDYRNGNRVISETKHLIVTKDRHFDLQQKLIKVYPVTTSGGISLFNGTFFFDQDHLNRDKLGLSNNISKFNKKIWYVYRLTFWVKDYSVEQNEELFPIHLFNFDGNGSDFFPDIDLAEINNLLEQKTQQRLTLIELDADTSEDFDKVIYQMREDDIEELRKERRKIQGRMQEWVERLYERTDLLHLMTVLVEPMYDKFDLRYRVSRTKLNYFELPGRDSN